MNKSDLIDIIYKKYKNYKKKDIKKIVDKTFDAITDALKGGDRVEIRGLGSFKVKKYPPRLVRNPKNGEKIKIPERKTVHFKIGKVLKRSLFKNNIN